MGPNKENIKKLTDLLSNLKPGQFDMEIWGFSRGYRTDFIHGCGSCACIGGWAEALMEEELGSYSRIPDDVGEWLGFNPFQVSAAFFPSGKFDGKSPYDATNQQAIRLLNHFAETGNVDWGYALGDDQ